MKRKIVLSVFIAILTLSLLSSCLPGVSVSLVETTKNNLPRAVLIKVPAYRETLSYFKNDTLSYKYSIYIENNSSEKSFNVLESHSDLQLFAYEGELYSVTKERSDPKKAYVPQPKIYAILQAFGTYSEYVEKYMTSSSIFDDCTYYQKYSKNYDLDGVSVTEVCYEADPSNNVLNQASDLGIKPGDKIRVVYIINNETKLVSKIDYYSSNSNALVLFLTRSFEYFDQKQDVFSSLPTLDNTFDAYIVYNPGKDIESTSHFSIPVGCEIGIDTNGRAVSFFEDENCTVPFDFETFTTTGKDEVYIYALFD